MSHHRAVVEGAILNPTEIRHGTPASDCRVHDANGPRSLFVAVIADVVAGFVKTADLTRAMKEASEWP